MPLYEYQCVKCKRRTEKIESVSGPHLKKCPHCGGRVEQTLTAPAIQFKGSGWYVTDYAKKSSALPASGSEGGNKNDSGKDSGSGKAPSADSGSDSSSKKDSKPKAEASSSKSGKK